MSRRYFTTSQVILQRAKIYSQSQHPATVMSWFALNPPSLVSFGLGGNMSISSANPRRIAVAAGYGALAIGLPYGAATYASPESSAWALMALCVCGLGFAGFRRSRVNRLSSDIE
jgi:hypothetical protein